MSTEDPVFGLQWAAMSAHLWATITDAERDALTRNLFEMRHGADSQSVEERPRTMPAPTSRITPPRMSHQSLKIARHIVEHGEPAGPGYVRSTVQCRVLARQFNCSNGTISDHLRRLDSYGVRISSVPLIIDIDRLEALENGALTEERAPSAAPTGTLEIARQIASIGTPTDDTHVVVDLPLREVALLIGRPQSTTNRHIRRMADLGIRTSPPRAPLVIDTALLAQFEEVDREKSGVAMRIARHIVNTGQPAGDGLVEASQGGNRLARHFGCTPSAIREHMKELDRLGVRVSSSPTVIDLAALAEFE